MIDSLIEIGIFFCKTLIVIFFIFIFLHMLANVLKIVKDASKSNDKDPKMIFTDIKKKRDEIADKFSRKVSDPEELKICEKSRADFLKATKKVEKSVKEEREKVIEDKNLTKDDLKRIQERVALGIDLLLEREKAIKEATKDLENKEDNTSSKTNDDKKSENIEESSKESLSKDKSSSENKDEAESKSQALIKKVEEDNKAIEEAKQKVLAPIGERIAAKYSKILLKKNNCSNSSIEYNEDGLYLKTKVLYVLSFNGSTMADEVKELRRAIDLIVEQCSEGDEVLLKLESPGGTVCGYGLCAAELERLKKSGVKLTIAVDQVAASGGYMMACVADRLVAAPFAYIGSIGVVSEFPNFNRLLKKYDVDYEQVTAGEFKRTMGQFAENTEEGRKKYKEQLESIHSAFKNHVKEHRPNIDIDKVATGEHWIAKEALDLGLIDELMTSDECLDEMMDNFAKVIAIDFVENKNTGLIALLKEKSAIVDFCSTLISKINKPRV